MINWEALLAQQPCKVHVPMMMRLKVRSSPLSSRYTMLTKALLAAGFPTGAPWIRSFRVFTLRLLVFSASTKLIASIRLDFPTGTRVAKPLLLRVPHKHLMKNYEIHNIHCQRENILTRTWPVSVHFHWQQSITVCNVTTVTRFQTRFHWSGINPSTVHVISLFTITFHHGRTRTSL